MIKARNKYKNLYLFIVIVSLIGLISGYTYQKYLPDNTKTEIKDTISIKNNLNKSSNKIGYALKKHTLSTLYSTNPITGIINIINIFYEPFCTGFIISIFKEYSLNFQIIYLNIYFIIPLLITILIIKNSLVITYAISTCLIKKQKESKIKIIKLYKKQLILIAISILYELIIWLYSGLINAYLITLI